MVISLIRDSFNRLCRPVPSSSPKSCLFHAVSDEILAASPPPNVDHREPFDIPSCTTKYDAFDQMSLEPIIGSWIFSTDEEELTMEFNAPGLVKTESDESLCVFVRMPGVTKKDVKVRVENNTLLVIEAESDQISYFGKMTLPDNLDKTSSDITGEMQDGLLKLTFPKLKHSELKTSIFAKFMFKLRFRHFSSVADGMFLEFDLTEEEVNSITMYKEVAADSIHISSLPGLGKMELTRHGACVSLNMPQLKIGDVKTYFKGEMLFIEGKTKTKTNKVHYYITRIRLPETILKKRNMIKIEMRNGMYKATLPYVTADIEIN